MDIERWLRELGLEQYEVAFRENEIDDTVLPSLTAEDLKDLGVSLVGHRRKLLDAIAALRTDTSKKARSSDFHPTTDIAERRQITLLFSDFVDSTALSGRMDPEDLRSIISLYHRCCTETIEHNGVSSPSTWAMGCSPISAIRRPMSMMPSARFVLGLPWSKQCRS